MRVSRIETLNHLRFSAALLVFGSHVGWSRQSYSDFFSQGFVGVSIFFVLSGFVMSFAYTDRILSRSISFRTFVYLRLARLAPLSWLVGLISLIAIPLVKSESVDFKATDSLYFFFLQSWLPSSEIYFSVNPPSWSISNELFFYFVFFPLILFARRRILFFFVFLLGACFLSAIAWTVLANDFGPIFGENSFSHWLFYIFPVFRSLEFIAGILVHRLWARHRQVRFLRPRFVYPLLAVTMLVGPCVPEAFRFSLYYLPIAALLVYAHAQCEDQSKNRLLGRPLRELGDASYSFYMIHFLFIQHISIPWGGQEVKNLLLLTIVFLVAILAHRSFEKPVQFFLNRKIRDIHGA